MDNQNTIIIVAGFITTIGTAIYTIQSVVKHWKTEQKEHKNEIIQEALEADEKLKRELVAQIDALSLRLENVQENVDKDMAHMKSTYNNELKNLGDKIEELRSELREQHGNLVQLLTKMIDRA